MRSCLAFIRLWSLSQLPETACTSLVTDEDQDQTHDKKDEEEANDGY